MASRTIPVQATDSGAKISFRTDLEATREAYEDLEEQLFQAEDPNERERILAIMHLARSQRRDDNERKGKGGTIVVTPVSPRVMNWLLEMGYAEPLAHSETTRYSDPVLGAGLHVLMQRLTPAQRDAARLVWGEGLTQKEAAKQLNVTRPAITVRLRTAKRVMHGLFESESSYADIKDELRAAGREAGEVLPDGQRPTMIPDEAAAIEAIDSLEAEILEHTCDVICQKTDSKVAARSSSAKVVSL